ncbi:MAG TPA: alpha/beta hydrolase [Gemmatimonadaceae bacterium]|nr:alpha/beta hydrolase [Gemmatimonadaceae bacterium]
MRNTQNLLACLAAALVMSAALGACQAKDPSPAADSRMSANPAMTTATKLTAIAAPDAQMKAVLDAFAALGPKPLETLTPAEARKGPTPADAAKDVMKAQGKSSVPDPSVTSIDRTISTATGVLPVRIYTPGSGAAPFPVVVYYHGGGWVIANKDVYDGGARALSKMAGAVVVSVDYRQGPEHKFPAAHDDAYAAYEWATKNASSVQGDPKRIALAGESAGGGLAVATAIMARDKGIEMPVGVVSVYPIAGTDTTTASYVENASAKPLSRAGMSWFFSNYLNGQADRSNPRVNLVAADLKNLPPTTIINAQIDPLRSEGEMLAEKLRTAGVEVSQKTYVGVTHEFFGMGAVVDKGMEAEQMAADALKKVFGTTERTERGPEKNRLASNR